MRVVVLAVLTGVVSTSDAYPQQVLVGPRRNAQVEAILTDVSPTRIETTVRKLAGFCTRHTLSDRESPTRGIGAARRWVKQELQETAKGSGGRLRTADSITSRFAFWIV